MFKAISAIATLVTLAACQTPPAPVLSLAEQAMAAKSPAALEKIGGRALTASDVMAELMDRPLRVDDRRWTISSDGSWVSSALDGTWSWGSNWTMLGDRFCSHPDRCGTLYELAGVYRFAPTPAGFTAWSIVPN